MKKPFILSHVQAGVEIPIAYGQLSEEELKKIQLYYGAGGVLYILPDDLQVIKEKAAPIIRELASELLK